jgi:hypothetical protein
VTDKRAFLSFLEYLYCDIFMSPLSLKSLMKVCDIVQHFELPRTFECIKRHEQIGEKKIESLVH